MLAANKRSFVKEPVKGRPLTTMMANKNTEATIKTDDSTKEDFISECTESKKERVFIFRSQNSNSKLSRGQAPSKLEVPFIEVEKSPIQDKI